jgi:hypothetical protein
VAVDSALLRSIDPLVGGKFRVECVLDGGSSIISIQRAVWEKLQLPMSPDNRMVMEAENCSENMTLRVISNLEIWIGELSFFVQAQIISQAPYNILLDRPWEMITRCMTQNYMNSDQDLTIYCPNTGKSCTLCSPTDP